jgi:hypothetical protein
MVEMWVRPFANSALLSMVGFNAAIASATEPLTPANRLGWLTTRPSPSEATTWFIGRVRPVPERMCRLRPCCAPRTMN